MSKIFLSYRRSDTQGWAGRLNEALEKAFGSPGLFLDTASIPPGAVFVAAIERALRSCKVMLVLIGPHWLSSRSLAGTRRLDELADYVRLEVAAGLEHGLRVIPVLLGQAAMPRAEDLPAPLASLAVRQAFELSDTRWDHDCDRLVKVIGSAAGLRRRPASRPPERSRASLRVANNLVATRTELGEIVGEKNVGAGTSPGRLLEVASGARLTDARVGSIVGIVSTGRSEERR